MLPVLQSLPFARSGFSSRDDEWAMWYLSSFGLVKKGIVFCKVSKRFTRASRLSWCPVFEESFVLRFLRGLPVNHWYRCLIDGCNAWAMSCLEDVFMDAWWNLMFHTELQGSRNRCDRLNVMLQVHERCMEKEPDNEEKCNNKTTRMTMHFLFNFQLLADKKN